ncbi:hypothetical protein [Roseivivax sediminis]|uniref:Uncharacterized protein n=1 Tax=Roseivivax sediminis TaxID=936889 RepID=A0A1I1X6X2_9RHOB|nr:hypothetical protein [Roseivivax sediminis]SFE02961.1 hypothetical protein SAMN04515678_105257 [Roseivivax sediminis]
MQSSGADPKEHRWMIEVLTDLERYSANKGMPSIEAELRRARRRVAAELGRPAGD